MEKQKFNKEYLAPEVFCIMMQLDQPVLSGSFSNEDIGDEHDLTDYFNFSGTL